MLLCVVKGFPSAGLCRAKRSNGAGDPGAHSVGDPPSREPDDLDMAGVTAAQRAPRMRRAAGGAYGALARCDAAARRG